MSNKEHPMLKYYRLPMMFYNDDSPCTEPFYTCATLQVLLPDLYYQQFTDALKRLHATGVIHNREFILLTGQNLRAYKLDNIAMLQEIFPELQMPVIHDIVHYRSNKIYATTLSGVYKVADYLKISADVVNEKLKPEIYLNPAEIDRRKKAKSIAVKAIDNTSKASTAAKAETKQLPIKESDAPKCAPISVDTAGDVTPIPTVVETVVDIPQPAPINYCGICKSFTTEDTIAATEQPYLIRYAKEIDMLISALKDTYILCKNAGYNIDELKAFTNRMAMDIWDVD